MNHSRQMNNQAGDPQVPARLRGLGDFPKASLCLGMIAILVTGLDDKGKGWEEVYLKGRSLRDENRPSRLGQYGTAMAIIPDLNNDGCSELVVSAPVGEAAMVDILSGKSLNSLRTIEVPPAIAGTVRFGQSLAHVANPITGQSFLVIGCPNRFMQGGSVVCFDLSTSESKYISSPSNTRAFGASLLVSADVDKDGVCDIMVGAPASDPKAVEASRGSVYIYSGASLELLASISPPGAGAMFGEQITACTKECCTTTAELIVSDQGRFEYPSYETYPQIKDDSEFWSRCRIVDQGRIWLLNPEKDYEISRTLIPDDKHVWLSGAVAIVSDRDVDKGHMILATAKSTNTRVRADAYERLVAWGGATYEPRLRIGDRKVEDLFRAPIDGVFGTRGDDYDLSRTCIVQTGDVDADGSDELVIGINKALDYSAEGSGRAWLVNFWGNAPTRKLPDARRLVLNGVEFDSPEPPYRLGASLLRVTGQLLERQDLLLVGSPTTGLGAGTVYVHEALSGKLIGIVFGRTGKFARSVNHD